MSRDGGTVLGESEGIGPEHPFGLIGGLVLRVLGGRKGLLLWRRVRRLGSASDNVHLDEQIEHLVYPNGVLLHPFRQASDHLPELFLLGRRKDLNAPFVLERSEEVGEKTQWCGARPKRGVLGAIEGDEGGCWTRRGRGGRGGE